MKKIIGRVVPILIIVLMIIFGKKTIDDKTYNYKPDVENALTAYFINGDNSGLQNILNLLDKYKGNEAKRKEIQNYSYVIVGSWFDYVDKGYNCENDTYRYNRNSCKVQLEEFKDLNTKLSQLYTYKSKEGFTIILPSYYNNLINQSNGIVATLENYVKVSSLPEDSESIRMKKCNSVSVDNGCDSCTREGICTCILTTDGVKETIKCKKDVTQ